MPSELTPEEKLLKLIKEGRPKIEAKPVSPSAAAFSGDSPLLPLRDAVKRKEKKTPESGKLSIAISLVWAAIVLLALGISYQFISGKTLLPMPHVKDFPQQSFSVSSTDRVPAESYENYQKIFEGRNVFKTIGEPPPVLTVEKSASFSELTRNLFLSGIIDGERPQAIIEDRSNGQIHYVESGDFIGSIQVVSVGSDHVILKYGDEEGQLTL